MLNPEKKATWLEALRSGRYSQAEGILFQHHTGGYCCIGVYLKEVCKLEEKTDGLWTCFPELTTIYKGLKAPDEPWLAHMETEGVPREVARHLAGMNDAGCSFAEIADYIEANL